MKKNSTFTRHFLLTILAFVLAYPALAGHFITDGNYRQSVDSAFNAKIKLVGTKFYNLKGLNATDEEQEALRFLYAYMPLADMTDYPTAYHLGNVRSALRARRDMPWGRDVPELLFRHFVLPMRVNNEPLDSSRAIFYRELKERVKGMTMKEAILEVNHWCHEHVTYEPSDARTSSPLQSIRTARGRCGEESTFTVSALRSIGIPARQVYTPRWAHTDDNHAWVEAWADGRWWFLGACEPEPVLDLAWFNAPASRAMLTHTRAFGDYRGPEEVVLKTSNFTEINLIGNYADTARCDFLVVDTLGNPVSDARVEFKIYNYAEYYSAVTKYTDNDGRTFLTAGLGDLVVWASKNGRYGYAKASFGKDRLVRITLSNDANTLLAGQDMDIIPPAGHANIPTVTAGQRAENDLRKAHEDSIRNAYTATFPTKESLKDYKFADAIPYIIKSRGNWRTIEQFLEETNRMIPTRRHSVVPVESFANGHEIAMRLLSTLSDKDLRDMPLDILLDNFNAWDYQHNQLCPRVEDEMISRPFKVFFKQTIANKDQKKYRDNPNLLVQWVRDNIRLNPDKRAMRIAQTPVGVWESRLTDERSRDIFFVDVARSIGIEARKDAVTGKVQYRKDSTWVDVNFDNAQQKTSPKGTLVLNFKPEDGLDNPKYYSHFTLSKIVDGRAQLLNFDEGDGNSEGTTWANTFKNGTELDEGTYMLVSGRRMADGSVLARNTIFRIKPGQTTDVELILRDSEEGVKVIGSFSSESLFRKINTDGHGQSDGNDVSILSQTGRGYYVLGVIATGQEPTNHALRDISKVRDGLNAWGRTFVLLFENAADAAKFRRSDYGEQPTKTVFGIDNDGSIMKSIQSNLLKGQTPTLPLFIIADTFDRVVFVSQGYTIGLGEQILKIANKL